MTAYFSNDDGVTWYELLLDGRKGGSAYPDIAQGADGTIYVIWDYSRSIQCEIRVARFTVQDVLSGKFESENSFRPYVTKKSDFLDITNVNTSFNRVIEVTKGSGTTKEEIIQSLPPALNVSTDDGNSLVLNGEWKANWFSSEYVGSYTFTFTPSNANNIQDINDFLKVTVKVSDPKPPKTNKGCGSVVFSVFNIVLILLSFVFVCYRKVKSREKRVSI